jgi:hypothetical protein
VVAFLVMGIACCSLGWSCRDHHGVGGGVWAGAGHRRRLLQFAAPSGQVEVAGLRPRRGGVVSAFCLIQPGRPFSSDALIGWYLMFKGVRLRDGPRQKDH